MSQTFLTTEELSTLIKYDVRTIRDRLKDSVLLEGRHYFRPFGGRKILYIWEAIELLDVDRIDHGVRCQEDEEKILEDVMNEATPKVEKSDKLTSVVNLLAAEAK